jgi:spore germination cell wall hydrolase CwlJ-like protein
MRRKTHYAGVAALAVGLATVFGNTELSGANAQATDTGPAVDVAMPLVEETVPQLVSQEVVQPLPEATESPERAEAASLTELVARLDAPAQLSRQLECLAGAVYFESRGEPLSGQLAVAQVIINRADSGLFPTDYCGVVTQPSQFSFVKRGRMPAADRGSQAWQQAVKIARIAHEGLWESEAGDALYFHARYVKPKWSYRKQALATISTHIFYR